MITLREYQLQAVDACLKELISGRNALLVAATGLGKTITMAELVRRTSKKILFLVNKITLANQTVKAFESYLGYKVGLYQGSNKSVKRVTIATVQSVTKLENDFNLIIFDEAHTITDKILEWIGKTPLLACTATPYNAQGLIYGIDKPFLRICFDRGLRWAVDNKFLVKPMIKHTPQAFDTSKLSIKLGDFAIKEIEALVMDSEKMIAQVKDAIPRLQGRNKVAWACSSIAHAEALNKLLCEFGELSITVHSKQDEFDISPFIEGNYRHITFVTMLSCGFDHPPIDAIVLMRPTRSATLMVQTIGRGLRLYEGKSDALILDYGNVIENCGSPYSPVINVGNKKNKVDIGMKFCPACLNYLEKKIKICDCGHEFTQEARDVLKNLTTTAYEAKPQVFKVNYYKQYKYTAKSGKICDRIDYRGLLIDVSEFFKIRFPIKDEWVKCDFEIECIKEGKYLKVVRVRNSNADS